jgi:hypothetical protein
MNLKIALTLILFLSFTTLSKTQVVNNKELNLAIPRGYISLHYGAQMSGIKDEDFVSSNYSPLFNIIAGKLFTDFFALQIGYKGFYFNTIADDTRHYYNYLFGEALINFHELVVQSGKNKTWNILLHAGLGYFYNHAYGRGDIHLNVGIQNTFRIADHFNASIDFTSIVGWDIYQGNLDILPGILICATYLFSY